MNKANPAPLGLTAFGTTTVLLNLHNIGLFSLNVVILSMGIFFGGFCQIFAGLLEYPKGNTFGLTAFTSYGAFWLTLSGILVLPKMGLAEATSPQFLGTYLAIWGLFTLLMFFGTLKSARMLQFVFISLAILFFVLAAGDMLGSPMMTHIGGWIGLVCGFSAIYLAMGELINEQLGRVVLPVG